jgi:hypothetical protein
MLIKNNVLFNIYNSTCEASTPSVSRSIHLYKNKYILVPCYLDRRINVLNTDLTKTGSYLSTSGGTPVSVASEASTGRVYVATWNSNKIDVYY